METVSEGELQSAIKNFPIQETISAPINPVSHPRNPR